MIKGTHLVSEVRSLFCWDVFCLEYVMNRKKY